MLTGLRCKSAALSGLGEAGRLELLRSTSVAECRVMAMSQE